MTEAPFPDSEPDVDHHIQLAHGKIRITQNAKADVWLVSWHPDEGIAGYPGHTYSSVGGECPNGPGLRDMVAWAMGQPWANRAGDFAAGTANEDITVVTEQVAELIRQTEEIAAKLNALRDRERAAIQQERADHAARELAEVITRLQAAADTLRASVW